MPQTIQNNRALGTLSGQTTTPPNRKDLARVLEIRLCRSKTPNRAIGDAELAIDGPQGESFRAQPADSRYVLAIDLRGASDSPASRPEARQSRLGTF